MDLGLPEILVVLVVLLLLFGPTKLPKLGESLGRAIRNFRETSSGRADRAGAQPPQATASPALPAAQPRTTLEPARDGASAEPRAADPSRPS